VASPLLVFILLVIVATQVVSTALDLRFQGILQDAMPEADKQTAFSGGFFAALNGVAAFLQFIVTPILLRFVPLKALHIGLPVVHLATCAVLTASPSLATAGAAYMVFKGLDYSVFRAAKEILYIPLSFDARYRAKEVIDVLGYRFSKGGSALLVVLGQKAGVVLLYGCFVVALAGYVVGYRFSQGESSLLLLLGQIAGMEFGTAYSVIALAAAAVWLVLAFPLADFYRRERRGG
jgi:ATP/ADP translocase